MVGVEDCGPGGRVDLSPTARRRHRGSVHCGVLVVVYVVGSGCLRRRDVMRSGRGVFDKSFLPSLSRPARRLRRHRRNRRLRRCHAYPWRRAVPHAPRECRQRRDTRAHAAGSALRLGRRPRPVLAPRRTSTDDAAPYIRAAGSRDDRAPERRVARPGKTGPAVPAVVGLATRRRPRASGASCWRPTGPTVGRPGAGALIAASRNAGRPVVAGAALCRSSCAVDVTTTTTRMRVCYTRELCPRVIPYRRVASLVGYTISFYFRARIYMRSHNIVFSKLLKK